MDIGNRLREERDRMGLNQEGMGAIGGVKKLAQFNYENGKRAPDSAYLAAIAAAGADVLYILTGQKQEVRQQGLPADEQMLLEAYQALPVGRRREVLTALLTGGELHKKTGIQVTGNNNRTAGRNYKEGSKQVFKGSVGNVAGRDIVKGGE